MKVKLTGISICLCVLISLSAVVSNIWGQSVGFGEEGSRMKKRMTPELLWQLGRLGEAVISPDGKRIAYTVTRFELSQNRGTTSLYVLDLASGGKAEVVAGWESLGSLNWLATPQGERLLFIGKVGRMDDTKTEGEGTDQPQEFSQIWSLDSGNGNMVQMTNRDGGVANLKVAPRGDYLAFTADIKLDDEVIDIYPDLPKADARIIDGLMYRHWNAWHDYKYSHLHVAAIEGDGKLGEPVDLMPQIKADCPVPPFGGAEQIAWSPDGMELAFTMKDVPDWAQSTDSDVYVVRIDEPGQLTNISAGMTGYDNNPIYSPDGRYLAFHSMERAGFEADRIRIMLKDRANGSIRELTQGLDQTVHGSRWLPDSKGIVFSSEQQGTDQMFLASLESPGVRQVSEGRFNWGVVGVFPDGERMLASRMDMLRPSELTVVKLGDATHHTITGINDEIYESLELPKVEERFVDATDGEPIHCWVIHPPDFDPETPTKWPMLLYCQGGPQGQIGQWFSYRWNFHLMAAQGYVVLAPNRRGLPGFGQQWNDQISGDWGGQAMKDLLSATDNMLAEPYIDRKRVAAIGASFGGYTVYWMMGNDNRRFCTMVAHCGVFNLESMYGSTEELFFVDWDLGGPYWSSKAIQEKYDQFSPHRFVGNWQTPLLVIHGEKDFRVPVTQGMEAFTAAQVKGVPSRFLYFPNEGHWVMKPQNGVLWHRVFFDWLARYCQ